MGSKSGKTSAGTTSNSIEELILAAAEAIRQNKQTPSAGAQAGKHVVETTSGSTAAGKRGSMIARAASALSAREQQLMPSKDPGKIRRVMVAMDNETIERFNELQTFAFQTLSRRLEVGESLSPLRVTVANVVVDLINVITANRDVYERFLEEADIAESIRRRPGGKARALKS